MDEYTQQEPIRINPKLPFAPIDLFSPVIAALAACFGRFDGLGVQDAYGWRWIAIQRLSRQFPQRIIDRDECSIAIPFVKIITNGAHWRKIRWKQAPLAARAMVVQQCVNDRAAIDVGRTPAVWRRGDDQRRDSGPLFIGQIGRIICWNGMVSIIIPQIRVSDRPLNSSIKRKPR